MALSMPSRPGLLFCAPTNWQRSLSLVGVHSKPQLPRLSRFFALFLFLSLKSQRPQILLFYSPFLLHLLPFAVIAITTPTFLLAANHLICLPAHKTPTSFSHRTFTFIVYKLRLRFPSLRIAILLKFTVICSSRLPSTASPVETGAYRARSAIPSDGLTRNRDTSTQLIKHHFDHFGRCQINGTEPPLGIGHSRASLLKSISPSHLFGTMIDLSPLGARPPLPPPPRPPPPPLPPAQSYASLQQQQQQQRRPSEDHNDPFYRLNFDSELYGDAFPRTLHNLVELREAESRAAPARARARAAARPNPIATVPPRGRRLRRNLLMAW